MIVANSGSVGLPFDGDQRASYLLVDGTDATVRRVEYDVERVVVDDFCVVTEGAYRAIWSGSYAASLGMPVDDVSADYLMETRLVIFWPCDENGLLLSGSQRYFPTGSCPGKRFCATVLPGTMDTPANRAGDPKADGSQWVQPSQVAALLVHLASDAGAQVTGAAIPIFRIAPGGAR